MTRDQLEHLIRAAAAVIGEDGLIVIGSQAIHGSVVEQALPAATVSSVEADFIPLDGDEAKADLIDGTIGEASMFQESFGVYARGVELATVKLPEGWRDRLAPMNGPATGWCLERHDIVAAKLIAGREKDLAFYRALRDAELVDSSVVAERIRLTPEVEDAVRRRALDLAGLS